MPKAYKLKPGDKLTPWQYSGGWSVVANKIHHIADGLTKADAERLCKSVDALNNLIKKGKRK